MNNAEGFENYKTKKKLGSVSTNQKKKKNENICKKIKRYC